MFFIIYWIISPIIWVIIPFASLFNPKIRHHFIHYKKSIRYAKTKINQNKKNKKVVLFHAASTGEFEQLKPILKLINREKYFILVSFSSPTAFIPENKTTLSDATCYHPFDLFWTAYLFFKKLNIKYYIITRNDIWPTHVFIANKLNIYTILINANFYKNTLYSSFINNFLYKSVLIRFNLILTGSKRLKDNLLNILQHNNILITGDSRIDRVIERKNNQKKLLPSSYKKSTTLILGSIVPSDCEYIFSALKKYLINGMETLKQNDQRIIIVPHEVNPKFLNGIISHLNKINLNYEYYSKQNLSTESRIMIIDKVGILADLYYYSDLAYIGAGFNGGIHSVIEPAIHYNAIGFGPNYKIVDMAVSLIRKKLASLIQNKTDILNFYNLMNDKAQLNNIKNNMKNFMNEQQSAAKIIVKEIFRNNNE